MVVQIVEVFLFDDGTRIQHLNIGETGEFVLFAILHFDGQGMPIPTALHLIFCIDCIIHESHCEAVTIVFPRHSFQLDWRKCAEFLFLKLSDCGCRTNLY